MAIRFLVDPDGSFLLVEEGLGTNILLVESDLAPYIWRNVGIGGRRSISINERRGVRVGIAGRTVRVTRP